jgi:hypothetical protein
MTLAKWFKMKTGISFNKYKQLIKSGDVENGVHPSEIQMIWNAALSFGDVPKVKQTDLKPYKNAK